MRFVTLLFLGVVASGVAHAEDDGETCNAILSAGLRDNFAVLTAKSQYDLFRHALCDTNYSTYETFREGASKSGLDVGFSELTLGLSGSSEEKSRQFEGKYRNYCQADFGTSSSRSLFVFRREDVNKTLVDGWNRCHADYLSGYATRHRTNMYASVSMGGAFDRFSLYVQRISNQTGAISFPSVNLGGAQCTYGAGEELKGGFSSHPTDGNTLLFSCTKRAFDTAAISLQSPDGATDTIVVPAETNKLVELEQQVADLRLSTDRAIAALRHWGPSSGFKASQRGLGGRTAGTGPGGPISCPDGQFVSAVQLIKEDTGGHCDSCVNGITVTCTPLNAATSGTETVPTP